jgi:hypothetical protein
LGLGLPLGVILLASLLAFVFIRRRKLKEKRLVSELPAGEVGKKSIFGLFELSGSRPLACELEGGGAHGTYDRQRHELPGSLVVPNAHEPQDGIYNVPKP